MFELSIFTLLFTSYEAGPLFLHTHTTFLYINETGPLFAFKSILRRYNEVDAEQHGSLSFKDVGIVRCKGYIRWVGLVKYSGINFWY